MKMKIMKSAVNQYVTRKEPMSLIHFITNRCNARCKHCFIDFKNPETFKGELSLEEIHKLTSSLGKSLFNVNLTGGEPFLRRDIWEIAKAYFENAGVRSIFITTNGMFTSQTKEFIDKFLASGIDGKITFSFSIDNFEKIHDENRRAKGLFRNTMKTYSMVRDYTSPKVVGNIGITVTDHNYGNVVELYRYLKGRGVRAFSVAIMREQGIVKCIDPEIKKKMLDAYAELTSLIVKDMADKSVEGYTRDIQGRLMNAKNKIMYEIIQEIYNKPVFKSRCPSAAIFGVIWANGDVYPCEMLPNSMGNLRDYGMDFMKLWNSEQTKKVRKFIVDTKCNCCWECAWSINIASNLRYIPKLASGVARFRA